MWRVGSWWCFYLFLFFTASLCMVNRICCRIEPHRSYYERDRQYFSFLARTFFSPWVVSFMQNLLRGLPFWLVRDVRYNFRNVTLLPFSVAYFHSFLFGLYFVVFHFVFLWWYVRESCKPCTFSAVLVLLCFSGSHVNRVEVLLVACRVSFA